MAVIIADGLNENVYYSGKYDPNNITPPACFAFGRDDAAMKPHQNAVDAGTAEGGEDGHCATCPLNAFGSGDTGKGKACTNRRRLVLIPAGKFDPQGRFIPYKTAKEITDAEFGILKIPPTSIKGYAAFVKQLATNFKRPPHGFFTKIHLQPDSSSQFKIVFEPLGQIPDALLSAVMKRHEEARGMIEAPYDLTQVKVASKKGGKKGGKKGAPPARSKGKAAPKRQAPAAPARRQPAPPPARGKGKAAGPAGGFGGTAAPKKQRGY